MNIASGLETTLQIFLQASAKDPVQVVGNVRPAVSDRARRLFEDPRRLPEPFCHTANDPEGAIDVEQIELPGSQDRAQLRVELVPEVVQPLR